MEKFSPSNYENSVPKDILLQLDNLGITNIQSLSGDILDVGAGDGNLGKYLSQNKNLKIIALDDKPSEKSEFKIIKGDVLNLPFNNESFDKVISHASIPNIFIGLYSFEHPKLSEEIIRNAVRKSFSEINRVLKQNGEAILAPVSIAENYNSQKMFKKIVLEEIEELRKIDYLIQNNLIRSEINPENNEKTDFYRIIIHKKSK